MKSENHDRPSFSIESSQSRALPVCASRNCIANTRAKYDANSPGWSGRPRYPRYPSGRTRATSPLPAAKIRETSRAGSSNAVTAAPLFRGRVEHEIRADRIANSILDLPSNPLERADRLRHGVIAREQEQGPSVRDQVEEHHRLTATGVYERRIGNAVAGLKSPRSETQPAARLARSSASTEREEPR